jgi:hypothetical protein
MNVLEKILEEIRDNAKLGNMHLESIRIEKVEEIIRSHMDEVTSEKEKVTSAEIITRQIDGKPYYHIKLKKVGEDEYTIGYSSFKLDYVVKWLNDYFEFCGEAKVSCDDNGWIPVEERLPENGTYLCTLDGELCGIDEPFTGMCGIENGKWDEEGCVIAWQPLPKPYKEEKKC